MVYLAETAPAADHRIERVCLKLKRMNTSMGLNIPFSELHTTCCRWSTAGQGM
jgi:hypothetical protein